MIAINVGVMVFKSVKKTRRQRRLNAIKKHKLEKHKQAIELLAANSDFSVSKGMSSAMNLWRQNNKFDGNNEIEVKVVSESEDSPIA